MVDCGHTGNCSLARRDRAVRGPARRQPAAGHPRRRDLRPDFDAVRAAGLLLFFSDGITEARNAAGELFGVERLTLHVEANAGLEPALLVDTHSPGRLRLRGIGAADRRFDLRRGPDRGAAGGPDAGGDRDPQRSAGIAPSAPNSCAGFAASFHPVPGEELVDALELAVNEAASNIMQHAYHGRADQSIHLEGGGLPEAIVADSSVTWGRDSIRRRGASAAGWLAGVWIRRLHHRPERG